MTDITTSTTTVTTKITEKPKSPIKVESLIISPEKSNYFTQYDSSEDMTPNKSYSPIPNPPPISPSFSSIKSIFKPMNIANTSMNVTTNGMNDDNVSVSSVSSIVPVTTVQTVSSMRPRTAVGAAVTFAQNRNPRQTLL